MKLDIKKLGMIRDSLDDMCSKIIPPKLRHIVTIGADKTREQAIDIYITKASVLPFYKQHDIAYWQSVKASYLAGDECAEHEFLSFQVVPAVSPENIVITRGKLKA